MEEIICNVNWTKVRRTDASLQDGGSDIPVRPAVSGNKDIDAMKRAMFMERMAGHRKAKAMQSTTNIQLYSGLYTKLHDDASKKLLDDPLWGEIERKQDPKGLMTAVTKFMLLSSSGNLHQDTHFG